MEYEQSCGPKNQQKGRQLTWQKPQEGAGIFRGVARGEGEGEGEGLGCTCAFLFGSLCKCEIGITSQFNPL